MVGEKTGDGVYRAELMGAHSSMFETEERQSRKACLPWLHCSRGILVIF